MRRFLTTFFLSAFMFWPAEVSADINIAVVAPLAGDYEILGRELVSGARIAVDEINSHGGLKGEKVNLVVIDDQCNDYLAVSSAQMIAVNSSKKNKMNLVIGPFCPNALGEVAKTYAKAKILQIIPTSVSKSEASVSYDSLIKLVGYSEQQSLDLFKYYLKNFDNQRLALAYNSGSKEAVGVAAELQEEFNKAGKAADFKSFNFANYKKDYEQMAEDIIEDKSGVVVVLGSGKESVKLAKALRREDKNLPVFLNRYQVQGRFLDDLGKYAEGIYLLSLPTLKENTEFTETLVKMRLLGVEPKGLSVYSYSAVKLWADLVLMANSYNFDKMKAMLPETVFETAWGEVAFSSGNAQNPLNYGIYRFNNGEYTQVY